MARLPILMYHNVTTDENKSFKLTISDKKLEKHFRYLHQNNYKCFHFCELENRKSIPYKSIIITFDDVTESQYLYVLPLLKKYNLKATFFIAFAYIDKSDLWNYGTEKIMSYSQLLDIDPKIVEFGFHSYEHKYYTQLSNDEIQHDFDSCAQTIAENNLKVYPALAYPYGNSPRKGVEKENFKAILNQNNIHFGLRIGNRSNKFPFKNKYEIQRIDIKGEEGMFKFWYKIKFNHLIKI
ncbi:polysaccharide deacetylase family protein [Flavobacterium muglaense]|uniref:Polysaccharide deacetylase family protein n=1 Tax=Flavobacterium muglaense TaxID=2764716 RepID=A0A923MXZ3_9FLAO|nr:polysaccharide deacetylase family protein [Flavobacterium muglaense]MBC5836625.1 polysaccharide deacetylase family protein [Flavobacterium muglaense]MBC5843109.1 polysaccharide deacetylase family protein [Flavobacterium muglaense]